MANEIITGHDSAFSAGMNRSAPVYPAESAMPKSSLNNQDMSSAIRVAIVEDIGDIREGLIKILDSEDGYESVGSFRTMEEALPGLRRLMASPASAPHVVLVDIGLPGMSGIEGIKLLKQEFPGMLCVVLSVFEDDQRIFEAICAGAAGYLLKKTPSAKLLESIREVVDGGSSTSPEVARRVFELFKRFNPPKQEPHNLTGHELRVLKLLVDGHNYKTAAAELGVTVHAVSFHVRRIYEKLQVHSKSEAVAKALKNRIV